jgi:hypothetical protein
MLTMNIELSPLEIRLLIKCNKAPLSKRDVTQYLRKYPKVERDAAIVRLVENGFIQSRVMPKEGSGKTPTFHFITDKGKKWLEHYYSSFPNS